MSHKPILCNITSDPKYQDFNHYINLALRHKLNIFIISVYIDFHHLGLNSKNSKNSKFVDKLSAIYFQYTHITLLKYLII